MGFFEFFLGSSGFLCYFDLFFGNKKNAFLNFCLKKKVIFSLFRVFIIRWISPSHVLFKSLLRPSRLQERNFWPICSLFNIISNEFDEGF